MPETTTNATVCRCGHTYMAHDAGECWAVASGTGRQCGCSWQAPATPPAPGVDPARIAQAIGDPGSIVPRIHTSHGDDRDETTTAWATRAVLAVLSEAATPPAGSPPQPEPATAHIETPTDVYEVAQRALWGHLFPPPLAAATRDMPELPGQIANQATVVVDAVAPLLIQHGRQADVCQAERHIEWQALKAAEADIRADERRQLADLLARHYRHMSTDLDNRVMAGDIDASNGRAVAALDIVIEELRGIAWDSGTRVGVAPPHAGILARIQQEDTRG